MEEWPTAHYLEALVLCAISVARPDGRELRSRRM